MLSFSFYFKLQRYLIEKTFRSPIGQEKKIVSILKGSQLLAAVFTGGVGYLFTKDHYRHLVTQKSYSSMVLLLRDTRNTRKDVIRQPPEFKGLFLLHSCQSQRKDFKGVTLDSSIVVKQANLLRKCGKQLYQNAPGMEHRWALN